MRRARWSAPALGAALLAIRAGGSAAGWAFQLQDPRVIVALLLLATAITLNLLRTFELPVLGSEPRPTRRFGTGALAAFVATPCTGPFMGAALGAALLLPAAGGAGFAALGLGLALPFLLVAFVPALRRMLPQPGPWMARFRASSPCRWRRPRSAAVVLWRPGGADALAVGLGAAVAFVAVGAGGRGRASGAAGRPAAAVAVALPSRGGRSGSSRSVPSGRRASRSAPRVERSGGGARASQASRSSSILPPTGA